MTAVQKSIQKYIDANFYPGSVELTLVGNDKIKVTDKEENNMTLSLNLYGDIIDTDTESIYAISDLPHNFPRHEGVLPQNWTEVDRQ